MSINLEIKRIIAHNKSAIKANVKVIKKHNSAKPHTVSSDTEEWAVHRAIRKPVQHFSDTHNNDHVQP